MRVMLCIPTFLLDQDEDQNSKEEIQCNQLHLAGFKVLVRVLEEKDGHTVYCALRTYNWRRAGFKKPRDAVERDWEEIHAADHVIACTIVHGRPSKGVHVEVGWATALKKPLSVLIYRPRTQQSVVITGLRNQPDFDVKYFYYEEDPESVFSELRNHLYSFEK